MIEVQKNDQILDGKESLEKFLKGLTIYYLQSMVMYLAFTVYWVWTKRWIIVGINYLVMFFFTYRLQRERWAYEYWKKLKMYEEYDLKKAGE